MPNDQDLTAKITAEIVSLRRQGKVHEATRLEVQEAILRSLHRIEAMLTKGNEGHHDD